MPRHQVEFLTIAQAIVVSVLACVRGAASSTHTAPTEPNDKWGKAIRAAKVTPAS